MRDCAAERRLRGCRRIDMDELPVLRRVCERVDPRLVDDDPRRDSDFVADATEDRQFIHVDQEAAALTPFGGTIAHGFLSLSLLSRMGAEAMLVPEATKMAINYGLDRVRFLAPVRSGSRVRGRFTLDSVEEKPAGQILMRHNVTVDIDGETKPALSAVWLTLVVV